MEDRAGMVSAPVSLHMKMLAQADCNFGTRKVARKAPQRQCNLLNADGPGTKMSTSTNLRFLRPNSQCALGVHPSSPAARAAGTRSDIRIYTNIAFAKKLSCTVWYANVCISVQQPYLKRALRVPAPLLPGSPRSRHVKRCS